MIMNLRTGATYLCVLLVIFGLSYGSMTLMSVQLEEFRQVRNWQRSLQEYALFDSLAREIEYFLQEDTVFQVQDWEKRGDLHYRIEILAEADNHCSFQIRVTRRQPFSEATAVVMEVEFEKVDSQWKVSDKRMERVGI